LHRIDLVLVQLKVTQDPKGKQDFFLGRIDTKREFSSGINGARLSKLNQHLDSLSMNREVSHARTTSRLYGENPGSATSAYV
jgi:hypothetical protein